MKTFKIKLHKNDKVSVIAGKDKNKTGKILTILVDKNKAKVEGVNMVKRHVKPNPKNQGGIIEQEAFIHLSNLMLICPKCSEPARVSMKILEDGKKVRICKKCGDVIPIVK